MFKSYFENIEYIEVGPVIGLIIFFMFFVVLIYLVVRTDKRFISRMKNLPLDESASEDHERSTSTQT